MCEADELGLLVFLLVLFYTISRLLLYKLFLGPQKKQVASEGALWSIKDIAKKESKVTWLYAILLKRGAVLSCAVAESGFLVNNIKGPLGST